MDNQLVNNHDIKAMINADYYNNLDIEGFSSMMKDPSSCYKFYWLEAIVCLISEGVERTTFNDIIDEMIANAWYSVVEYHIHLSGIMFGEVRDGLERAVLKLAELSGLNSNVSKVEIKANIKKYDKYIQNEKKQLTNMVPYRALAGFFVNAEEEIRWDSITRMVAYIDSFNQNIKKLPYVLGDSPKLKKEVIFNSEWIRMIQDNTVSILGWIQFEKVKWLQNNNPEVPGLVYKLAPLNEKMRKLGNVRKLWSEIIINEKVRDVFTDKTIESDSYDVDHFVPWSFVMNDELWNLMPMDSSLNSVKSNKLPMWEPYFEKFASNQYLLYMRIQEFDKIRGLFEKCYRDNLHSIWAIQELYKPGNSKQVFFEVLESNMRPVYDSARRQGYSIWKDV